MVDAMTTYFSFVTGSASRETGNRPATSALSNCRILRFIETGLSVPYLHHLSNAIRSAGGRITLMRTIFSSFGVLGIRKTLNAPDALDNIRTWLYYVN